jgi:hypothetical protein
MTRVRLTCLLIIGLCAASSLTWGIFLSSSIPGGVLDFQNIYDGTDCLLHHCDPYSVSQLDIFTRKQGIEESKLGINDPVTAAKLYQGRTLYVYLPTTFLFIAPFTFLGWGPAHVLWMALVASSFILAAILMWDIGARYSPGVAALLVCIVVANSEIFLASGNPAGIVVSLCVIAVWCFLEERFVPVGMLCFVIALAIKPHDAGLVWLYFLLAGGAYRKRALQIFIIVGILAVVAGVWLSHLVPHWLPEIRANLATISGPGGLNNPGPGSLTGNAPNMVIDLQAAASVFWNNPRFYNLTSYLVCGIMLLFWVVTALRSRFSVTNAWLALASIIPITLLVTYHRPYDARLLLLSAPACAILWARGGSIARIAVLLTAAGVALTGDIPLAISILIAKHLLPLTAGLPKLILTVLFMRPASLVLLILAIFYLWVYVRSASAQHSTTLPGDPAQISVRANQTASA